MTLDEYAARYSDNPNNLPVKYYPEKNGFSESSIYDEYLMPINYQYLKSHGFIINF